MHNVQRQKNHIFFEALIILDHFYSTEIYAQKVEKGFVRLMHWGAQRSLSFGDIYFKVRPSYKLSLSINCSSLPQPRQDILNARTPRRRRRPAWSPGSRTGPRTGPPAPAGTATQRDHSVTVSPATSPWCAHSNNPHGRYVCVYL